jgi:autotransporter-associated beta strand protein
VEVAWAGPGILDTNSLPATNIIASNFLTPVDINSAPQFANQTLQVFNTVSNNTFIGIVSAADSPLDTLTFKIISGNTNNMFAINPDTGGITVMDSSLIATGGLTSFSLGVLVQDSGYGGLYPLHSAQATVTINVVGTTGTPFVWTGGAASNNWASSGNWGGAVPASGARVSFGFTLQQTNINDAASTLGSAQFTTGGFNVSGNPLTLQSGLTNLAGANVWGINTTLGGAQIWSCSSGTLSLNGGLTNAGFGITLVANSDIQLAGPVSGTGSFSKNGTARLLMQGVHTYSGSTVISAASGTTAALQLAGPSDLDIRNSDLTMNGRMDLGNYDAVVGALIGSGTIYANDFPQPTLTIGANNHSGTFSGVIQDNTVGLGVTLGLVKTGSGAQTLSGNNTFTGGLVVSNGTLTLSAANGSSPAGRGTLTVNSGTLVNATVDNQLGLETSGYLTALNVAGGVFNAWNYMHVNSITFAGGTLGVTSGASQVDGADLRAYNSVNPLVTALASSSTANFASKMTLNAPCTFDVADGSAAIDLLVSGVIVGAGSLTKTGPGTVVLTAGCTYSGGTLINGGVFQVGSGSTTGSVAGNITNNAALVFSRSGGLTESGVISGSGSLTKTGSGALTLTSVNAYTGPTTISLGTLTLGAAAGLPNTALITLQSGAVLNVASVTGFSIAPTQTLTGVGSVAGNVLVNGTLSPGLPLGGMSFTGSLTLAGTNRMEINNVSGLTNDSISVTGTLTYGGALVVTNSGTALSSGDTFALYSASAFAGGFSTLTLPPLTAGLHWDLTQLSTNGTIRVAPPTPPLILPVSLVGTNLQISIPTELGVSYILQSAPALVQPISWAPVSTNSGTGNTLTQQVPVDPATPQQYFRFVAY